METPILDTLIELYSYLGNEPTTLYLTVPQYYLLKKEVEDVGTGQIYVGNPADLLADMSGLEHVKIEVK